MARVEQTGQGEAKRDFKSLPMCQVVWNGTGGSDILTVAVAPMPTLAAAEERRHWLRCSMAARVANADERLHH